jgi:hypothetical protein
MAKAKKKSKKTAARKPVPFKDVVGRLLATPPTGKH